MKLFLLLAIAAMAGQSAKADDTYDVSTYAGITNGDFNGSIDEWNHSGFNYNSGTWSNNETMSKYAEKWVNNPYTLANCAIWQNTSAILPAGTYTLTFNYNGAVNNEQNYDMSGVTAFCGDAQQALTTINATTVQTCTMTFTTTEARYLDLGVECSSTTNINWLIIDNVKLLWNGTEADFNTACSALPTTASLATPIDYSNRVTNFGTHCATTTGMPGWTKTGSGGGNCEFVSVIGDQAGFVYWNGDAQSNAELIYQDITDLPAGAYTMEAYAAATVWNGNAGGENKGGCYVFAGSSDVEITSATYSKYTFGFTLSEAGTVRIGIKSKANEGNNWCFLSKVKLTYLGNSVAIDEKQNTAASVASNVDVKLTRTLSASYWNTLCLPFSLTAEQIAASPIVGASIKQYSSVSDNTMTFTDATEITAGKPYLIKPEATVENPSFTDVSITVTEGTTNGSGITFTGLLCQTDYTKLGTNPAYLATDGTIQKLSSGTLKGMRAYFNVPSGTNVKLYIDGTATDIRDIDADNHTVNKCYSLSGQQMLIGQLHKGIYVRQGKKFIIK